MRPYENIICVRYGANTGRCICTSTPIPVRPVVVLERMSSGLFVPNQVGDCGFGAGKVLVCPRGQTALLLLSDRKKERRLPASLSPSVRMCADSLHNYSIIIHCRFQSATKTMERHSKSSPFPWAQLFSSHNQFALSPL